MNLLKTARHRAPGNKLSDARLLARLALCLLATGCALASPVVSAQKPAVGAPAPITIEADQMQYDDKARVNVFEGNVVMVRGDLEIRAARLRLTQDADGNQQALANGQPARFVQRRADGQMQVEGKGNELRYSNKTEEVIISGGATLLRSLPGQTPDRVSGARIIYKSQNDFFTVEGGKEASTETNPRGRVQVVIQPRSKTGAAAPKPGTALAPARQIQDSAGAKK